MNFDCKALSTVEFMEMLMLFYVFTAGWVRSEVRYKKNDTLKRSADICFYVNCEMLFFYYSSVMSGNGVKPFTANTLVINYFFLNSYHLI